ncbi:MAG: S-layer homology domain-containing protein, partial [Actinomycetota bacterium]|nr:S-layer homology domain-containing protein [Actinomycetota bacterium]
MLSRRVTLVIAATITTLSVVALAAAAASFVDVPDTNVFSADIEWLADQGITKGCNPPTNDLFCPTDNVTREQMAAFLVRALGLTDDGGGNTFTDDNGSIFEDDIAKLAAAGITKGCNPPFNTQFCPTDNVTREQMAAFLRRAINGSTPPPPPPPAQDQPEPPITAAFMYPWFPNAWDQGGQIPFSQFTPSAGLYDSSDPDVIDEQVSLATTAGLEAFIASWWGPGHHTDSATMAVLNQIPDSPNPNFRIAIYYEEEGQSDPSPTAIKNDLEYLEQLFNKPSYLRVDGKPVVFVWAEGDGADMARRWKDAKDLYGGNVHIVLKLFSGFRDVPDQPDSWHQYGPSTNYSEHLPDSAVVSPGFWHAEEGSPRLVRDPVRFRDDVQSMVASGAFWQLITTWNEWGEGTAVEPA